MPRPGGGGSSRRLGLGSQCRLSERIELHDRSPRDTEDLPPPAPESDPRFECRDALGPKALEQRRRQIGGQCVFHARQSSQFGAFAKRDLTSCRDDSGFSDAFRVTS